MGHIDDSIVLLVIVGLITLGVFTYIGDRKQMELIRHAIQEMEYLQEELLEPILLEIRELRLEHYPTPDELLEKTRSGQS